MVYLNKEKGMGKEKIAELFGISKVTVVNAVTKNRGTSWTDHVLAAVLPLQRKLIRRS